MHSHHNRFLLILFFLLSSVMIWVSENFKSEQHNEALFEQYNNLAIFLHSQIDTLIEDKKNATLSLAIALAQSDRVKNLLKSPNPDGALLRTLVLSLKHGTKYKNAWIQLVDAQGYSKARSWTKSTGDHLAAIRPDVRNMIIAPEARATVSVGQFDMTFKSMVPIYDESNQFIGFIEVITHFNSIAEKLKAEGFDPLILTNEKYYSQLLIPFTQKFVGKHYVANLNVNPNLMRLVEEKGLSSFISNEHHYTVNEKEHLLIINYTLFDTEQQHMANILAFKNLSQIQLNPIKLQEKNINLILILSIFILAGILYLIANKKETPIQPHNRHYLLLFLLAFIFFFALSSYLIQWRYEEEKNAYLYNHSQNLEKNYQIINQKYHTLAEILLKTLISKPQVIEQLKKAYGPDKDQAREKLYQLLIADYNELTQNNLRQLHFHLKNNESFLRFHRPQKYGDDLSEVRSTVAFVNRNLSAISGFEEGRIFNGFRNVFPIISKPNHEQAPEHLGSVEISYSPYAIAKDFLHIYQMRSGFIIKEQVVAQKVFSNEKHNYQTCKVPGYLFDASIQKRLDQGGKCINFNTLDSETLKTLDKKLNQGEIFSLESADQSALYTFIPLINPVSQEVVAAYVFQQNNRPLQEIKNHYLVWNILSGILILLVLLYIYKEFSSARTFKLLSEKNQLILDTQKSIVFVTEGNQIVNCNRAFLDFFDVPSLEAFKQQHNCVCDLFEKNDRLFHLGKVQNQSHWIQYLQLQPAKDRLVSILDAQQQTHIFAVEINAFQTNQHIISFTDISDTMNEQFSLELRATHDPLTKAYNRDYFEKHIHFLEKQAEKKQRVLGLILFDIDHFKQINDSFGHHCGDIILMELVKLIKQSIRADDVLIRWGGEEFLVIIQVENRDQLAQVAENLRQKVATHPFPDEHPITCSFGGALHLNHQNITHSINHADQALYFAKGNGRNQVKVSKT